MRSWFWKERKKERKKETEKQRKKERKKKGKKEIIVISFGMIPCDLGLIF